jgi:hypothetical protein
MSTFDKADAILWHELKMKDDLSNWREVTPKFVARADQFPADFRIDYIGSHFENRVLRQRGLDGLRVKFSAR